MWARKRGVWWWWSMNKFSPIIRGPDFPQLSVVRIFPSYPWSGFSLVIRGPDFPQLSVVRIFPNYPWSGFSPVIRGPDFSNCPSSGMFDWGNNGKDRKFENTLTLNTIVCTTVLFLQFVYFFFRHNVLHFEKSIFFQNSSWDLQEVANWSEHLFHF